MGEIQRIFFLFIYTFFHKLTSQTRRRIFTLDGSNDADSRKDVLFGGFVDISEKFRELPEMRQL